MECLPESKCTILDLFFFEFWDETLGMSWIKLTFIMAFGKQLGRGRHKRVAEQTECHYLADEQKN